MRVLIVRQPSGAIDGIPLAPYCLGESYDLPPNLANYLVALGFGMFEPWHQHVLIVDDESSVRLVVQRWLEGWGYRVSQAASATDALEILLADAAPIILTDINMPVHDGFWLMKRVRAKWPSTAFIMATGVGDLETVKKSRQAGAVDYVLKPFGRELLRQALDRASAAIASGAS